MDRYNNLCGKIRSFATELSLLNPQDPFRTKMTDQLLGKLAEMGIITVDDSLSQAAKVSVSAFCRRRLAVILVKNKMAQSVKQASRYIQHGHIRIGPSTVTDPAFLVTRKMEDFVTWSNSSKIRRIISKYNDELDDYDLL